MYRWVPGRLYPMLAFFFQHLLQYYVSRASKFCNKFCNKRFSKPPTSLGCEFRLNSLRMMTYIGLGQVGGETLGRTQDELLSLGSTWIFTQISRLIDHLVGQRLQGWL